MPAFNLILRSNQNYLSGKLVDTAEWVVCVWSLNKQPLIQKITLLRKMETPLAPGLGVGQTQNVILVYISKNFIVDQSLYVQAGEK